MEKRKKFRLKMLFCEHVFHYKCSNCFSGKVLDYYQCKHCWKFITIVRPDFIDNILNEVREIIK